MHSVLSIVWALQAGEAALGGSEIDLLGHVWTIWHATQEPLTYTHLVGYPEGIDLLPILGGWADIVLAGWLTPFLGLISAFNAVTAIYLTIVGIGINVLARCFGARLAGAFLAGTLFQLEPFILHHLTGGRTEQLGVGFVALAIAAGVHAWRTPNILRGMLFGLAYAVVVFVCWEYAFLLAGLLICLGIYLFWRERNVAGIIL